MSRRPSSPRGLLLALLAVPVTILVGAAGALVQQGAVLIHQCVAGDSAAGLLGLRLALLRADGDCPAGTLSVGGDGRQVLGVVAIVALPVLLAHLAGLGAGLGLLALLRRLLSGAVAVIRSVVPHVPVHRVLVVARRPVPLVTACAVAVGRLVGSSVRRRGPPVLQPA